MPLTSSKTNLKRCPQCQKVKKESHFRYIKYFHERRRICTRCEALERRKRKRDRQNERRLHVQEHGVTRSVWSRLRTEAAIEARKQATKDALSDLPVSQRRIYSFGRPLLGLCLILILFLTGQLSSAYQDGHFVESTFLLVIDLISVGVGIRLYRQIMKVDTCIKDRSAILCEALFQEALRERIEYENFYRSPEWGVLRDAFLQAQKKVNGWYICGLCSKPIFSETDLTIDHIKPRSKFPNLATEISNLRIACHPCNSSKGDKVLPEK